MKRLAMVASFVVGCAVLLAAFGIGWANWGDLANRIGVVQTLMGALGVVVALLVAMGVLSKGKERWRASVLVCHIGYRIFGVNHRQYWYSCGTGSLASLGIIPLEAASPN